MRILVYGNPIILKEDRSDLFGHLIHPSQWNDSEMVLSSGKPYAADNGAFSGFDEGKFRKMLGEIPPERCLWVSAPDVVGNAEKTLDLFRFWEPIIKKAGFPVAFVGQDGLRLEDVPWSSMECFFIGGSTEWKLSGDAWALAYEAKRQGISVHMGRVNSLRRMKLAHIMGCDTIDGSTFNLFSDTYVPKARLWLNELRRQQLLKLEPKQK